MGKYKIGRPVPRRQALSWSHRARIRVVVRPGCARTCEANRAETATGWNVARARALVPGGDEKWRLDTMGSSSTRSTERRYHGHQLFRSFSGAYGSVISSMQLVVGAHMAPAETAAYRQRLVAGRKDRNRQGSVGICSCAGFASRRDPDSARRLNSQGDAVDAIPGAGRRTIQARTS